MATSSQKAKLLLRDEIDNYIINYRRFSGKEPGAIPITESEKSLITELVVEYQQSKPADESVYYEVSNNPEIDTLLVFKSCELYVHPEAVEIRNLVR